ncbi:MAG: hypothetical protein K2Y29_08630 [Beijerinckiaceae bacterium]|nr:hypothetical protein [Beijerinckiaceae bacterium]
MLRFVLSAGMLAAMIGAADAAPKCSPGKIYRVSKKVCVDKTAAARAGVISPRSKKLKASAARKSARLATLESRKAVRVRTARVARVEKPEAPAPQVVEQTAPARTIILPPISNAIGSANAPFGALADPWSSDSFSALPETRFSLRTAKED